jgi:hypothetical protein
VGAPVWSLRVHDQAQSCIFQARQAAVCLLRRLGMGSSTIRIVRGSGLQAYCMLLLQEGYTPLAASNPARSAAALPIAAIMPSRSEAEWIDLTWASSTITRLLPWTITKPGLSPPRRSNHGLPCRVCTSHKSSVIHAPCRPA